MSQNKIAPCIIILNWNNWEDTIECLQSINNAKIIDSSILIIDNGSTDNSLNQLYDYCKSTTNNKKFKFNQIIYFKKGKFIFNQKINSKSFQINILSNDDNYGYAGGHNIAFKFLAKFFTFENYLILNNDTVVDNKYFTELTFVANKFPDYGIIGSRIVDYYNSNIIQSIGGTINMWTGRRHHFGTKFYETQLKRKFVVKVDFVSGASLLIKSDIIKNIGGFDEDYFLYVEDIDLCYRALMSGYSIYSALNSLVKHKISNTSRKNKIQSRVIEYTIRNDIIFMKKHAKRLQFITFLIISGFYIFKSPLFLNKSKLRIMIHRLIKILRGHQKFGKL